MKKLCLFLFLSVASVSVVMAQPRSIGLRLGGNQGMAMYEFAKQKLRVPHWGQSLYLCFSLYLFISTRPQFSHKNTS